jgi:co-chaperonin GroES (HSP10)
MKRAYRLKESEAASAGNNNCKFPKEKPQKGTIVAVGDGKKDEPLTVKVGDTVLYGKYSGTELKFEGKDYIRNYRCRLQR